MDTIDIHDFANLEDVGQRLGGTLLKHVPTGLWVTVDRFGGNRGDYTFQARDKSGNNITGQIKDLDYSSPKLGLFKDRDGLVSLAVRRPVRQYRGGVPIQSIELIGLSRDRTRNMHRDDLNASFLNMLDNKYSPVTTVLDKFFGDKVPIDTPVKRFAWIKTNSFGVVMLKYLGKTVYGWTHKGTVLEQDSVSSDVHLQRKLLHNEIRTIESYLKGR